MSDATHILVVDPDELLQEMIEAGTGLFNPNWRILKAREPEAALELLEKHRVEALVTEIEFDGSRRVGLDFLLKVEFQAPKLPVFIMTHAPADEVQRLTSADFIAKPPDLDYLIGKLHRAIQEQRESVLRGVSLEGLLQILEVEKKTCTVTVVAGYRVGRLFLRDGVILHAETDTLEGKAAAFTIFSWTDYSIRIVDGCKATITLREKPSAVLMEWCVEKDHGSIG